MGLSFNRDVQWKQRGVSEAILSETYGEHWKDRSKIEGLRIRTIAAVFRMVNAGEAL